MALLITAADVQQIIEYDDVLIPDLTPFMEAADTMIQEIIGDRLSDGALFRVQQYLSAHLVGITTKLTQAEQVKSLQETFQVRLSDGLGITHYGATAMLFDSTGRLANWNKRITSGAAAVSITWAGTDT